MPDDQREEKNRSTATSGTVKTSGFRSEIAGSTNGSRFDKNKKKLVTSSKRPNLSNDRAQVDPYKSNFRKKGQEDVLSQKLASNFSNLEDSIGVIGNSIGKNIQLKSKGNNQKALKKTQPKFPNHHNVNKSPDIVGNTRLIGNNSKERGDKVNNLYSATKSQANITNNNFAKFSSSGYTNNAFLLMSGHHDFT